MRAPPSGSPYRPPRHKRAGVLWHELLAQVLPQRGQAKASEIIVEIPERRVDRQGLDPGGTGALRQSLAGSRALGVVIDADVETAQFWWEQDDQLLDLTTKDDADAYVAIAALDETTPRFLRISGDNVSARDIAALSRPLGRRHRLARPYDSHRQAHRAAGWRRVPAMAGHAMHA